MARAAWLPSGRLLLPDGMALRRGVAGRRLGCNLVLQFGGLGPMHVATCSLGFLCISLKVSHGGRLPVAAMAGVTAADHEQISNSCLDRLRVWV